MIKIINGNQDSENENQDSNISISQMTDRQIQEQQLFILEKIRSNSNKIVWILVIPILIILFILSFGLVGVANGVFNYFF